MDENMEKINEDGIILEVIQNFRRIASDAANEGLEIVVEECVKTAITLTFDFCKRRGYAPGALRDILLSAERDIRERCEPIAFEVKKKAAARCIRKNAVEAVLDDLIEEAGVDMTYKVRGNSSVGIAVRSPSTGQYLRFNTASSKILTPEWRARLLQDINAFFEISAHLGKIRATTTGKW